MSKFDPVPPSHHITVGQRMTRGNMREVEGATPDTRKVGGKECTMPWSTGKPLQSEGMDPATGLPRPPALVIPISEGEKLAKDLDRAAVLDRASEGVLDNAEAVGADLEVEEQWFEAEDAATPSAPDWPPAESASEVTHPEVICRLCSQPVEAHDVLGFCPEGPKDAA